MRSRDDFINWISLQPRLNFLFDVLERRTRGTAKKDPPQRPPPIVTNNNVNNFNSKPVDDGGVILRNPASISELKY